MKYIKLVVSFSGDNTQNSFEVLGISDYKIIFTPKEMNNEHDFCSIGAFLLPGELNKIPHDNTTTHICIFDKYKVKRTEVIDCVIDLYVQPSSISVITI